MKKYFLILFIFIHQVALTQELYVSTEPASNMATGSIGFRLNSNLFKINHDGNVNRLSNSYFMMRLEYNLLNIFSKK